MKFCMYLSSENYQLFNCVLVHQSFINANDDPNL